jgi:hypothetical protein
MDWHCITEISAIRGVNCPVSVETLVLRSSAHYQLIQKASLMEIH